MMAAQTLSTPHTHTRSLSSSHRTPLASSMSQHQTFGNDAAMTNGSPMAIADTLPPVDFGFDDLKARMAQFTAKFDEFIEKGRKRVLEERNEYKVRRVELEESQSTHLKSLTQVQSLLSNHSQTLHSQSTEKSDLLSTISEISTRQTTVLSQRDRLRQQITDVQKQVDSRQSAQKDYSRKMDALRSQNHPELAFWESHLGMRIEGAGSWNHNRVTFWLINPNKTSEKPPAPSSDNPEEEVEGEAYFDISTAKREYELLAVRPRIDKEKLDPILERLNETRDFGQFLKGIRGLFCEALGGRR